MSEAPKAHVFEDSGQGTRHCAECGHHLEATWHFAKGSEHSALLDEVERVRAEPCACACHSVGGHTDEPTMGMALMDMTKRALTAEAELATLRARTCATCRHQGAWEDGTLVCHEWSDNDGWSAKCADILTCGAWAAQEQL